MWKAIAPVGAWINLSTCRPSGSRRGAFSSDAPEANDRGALTEFIFLILALAIVFRLAAPDAEPRQDRAQSIALPAASGTHGIIKISLGLPPPIVSASALYFGSFQATAPRRRIVELYGDLRGQCSITSRPSSTSSTARS